MQLHVSHTGAAYVCLNGVAPPVGSMVHSSYEEIIDVVKDDPWHNALMESGPLGLAVAAGLETERWESLIDDVGECRTCIELTRELASQRPCLDAEGE
jgi:hypothetical protein